MSTLTKIVIIAVATIIGAVCALFGGILKYRLYYNFGIANFGLPMWVGAIHIISPVTGGFFSFISSLITLGQTERKLIIFFVSAAVGFLAGFLLFNYMPF